MKKYLIFDLDGTLLTNVWNILSTIDNFFEENEPDNREKAQYIFSSTQWTPLKVQLESILGESHPKVQEYTDEIYSIILKNWNHAFFDKVPEKIKNLSKNYTLFLTTWNSTSFASNALQEWEIFDCFEKVIWSDLILKWKDHLEIFQGISWDQNFYKNSLYIWDGNSDREFAKEAWIDFIHIWNENRDIYEIESVTQIDTVLDRIKEEK